MTKIISRYIVTIIMFLSLYFSGNNINKTLKSIILISLLILIVIRIIYDVKKYRKSKN